jgi:hypothetical protein
LAKRELEIAATDDKVMPKELKAKLLERLQQAAEVTYAEATKHANAVLSLGSKDVNDLMGTPDGLAQLYMLLLKPNHPDVTEELAGQIAFERGEKAKSDMDQAGGTTPPNPSAPGTAEATPLPA